MSALLVSGTGVRLAGGRSLCSGRVEVLRWPSWGTICEADFDMKDAEVVCRQLDCGFPAELLRGAHFGEGQGLIRTEEIQCQENETRIHDCPTSTREYQSCSHRNDISLACTEYSGYRLVGGPDSCSGRVELQYRGEYRTVCDQYWDLRDATVLCQQLGCGEAVAAPGQAWFGQGSGSRGVDVFDCRGNETHLSQCAVSSWGRAACPHGQDTGIICSSSSLSALDGGVRLSGGESHCDGQVEVHYNSTWGRLLQHSWGYREASVVCRQLGCGSVMQISNSSVYETGDSAVCLTGIQCSGDESHLVNCSSPHTVSCNTGQDVALICSAQRFLRLVGAGSDCAGRLEVYHNGSWGTVCDDSWDLADSQVVCRQLQCGMTLSAPVPVSFSQGTGPIWLDEVGCLGNESSLWECPSAGWGRHDCGHKEDVRILCSNHTLMRLSAGCSGQAEVYYNGTWGSICANSMTDITAAVICKQLGCGDKGTVRETNSRLSPDPKWLDFVSCRKHDSTLWQCPSSPWGQNECEDREVAEITCSGPGKEADRSTPVPQQEQPQQYCPVPLALRLAGGTNCSGRVELWYEGSWGTVCDDSWDLQDAQVVCRQLGCGDAVSAAIEASFRPGSGTIWLDEVNCTGSELHLWDCCHSGLNQSNCQHKEDAGVTCTGLPVTKANLTATTVVTKSPRQPKQEAGGWTVPAVVFFLQGALVFVLLVLLVGQLIQNRRLRKALAEAKVKPMNEALYQEIDFTLTAEGALRRGRFLSDEVPSEYDDLEDSKGDPDPGKLLCDELQSEYDDVENNENDPISGVSAISPGVQSLLATQSIEDGCDYDDVGVS
ncbi:antigen WC1.1-like [Lepisosteus oculatus]|uniref:antigen WC1.1-like n=1 Tax=Lepisosteus oculatus TaxID=7918 RepID=UPI0035F50056